MMIKASRQPIWSSLKRSSEERHGLLLIGWQLAGVMGKLQSDWLMIYNYHNLFIKNHSLLLIGWQLAGAMGKLQSDGS